MGFTSRKRNAGGILRFVAVLMYLCESITAKTIKTMKRRIFAMLLVVFVFHALAFASPRKNLAKAEGLRIFKELLCKPAAFPVSFTYDGKEYKGFGKLKVLENTVRDVPGGKESAMRLALDEKVEVKTLAFYNDEFGEVEYTVWFSNIAANGASAVLGNVNSADIEFRGAAPLVRGCLGDHVNLYAPYNHNLLEKSLLFRSDGGRATHVVFPYFDLVHGTGGTLLAIGWAGTWNTRFEATPKAVKWTAQNCNGFSSVLLPGESVRTALVVMLPYKGRNGDDATNLWREWFVKYNMPKADGAGNPVKPFTTACFAGDTGLPNSDGSVSERFYTWRRTLDRLVYENVIPDFRWFDAGWYYDPAGKTVPADWWGTVGSWELDKVKWPGNSFRESNEACHSHGMKVLMWFEPERVTHVEDLVKNYGYKAEWAISNGKGVITNDLGNPECLEWTLGRITKAMGDNEVDLFREDNNSDPGTTWPMMDKIQSEKLGTPRNGITENKAIQGHYALWDGIIDYCAKNGKCTYIDNCASGGGRNDIESLRRSMPFLRSDADRTTTALRLSMSSTFNKWIPYSGASTKESVDQLANGVAGGSNSYITRASWLNIYNVSENFTHDVLLDYDRVRKSIGEWRKYNHLLSKDFYVLTPWHSSADTGGWTVFVYNNRDNDEGVIEAFRQENSKDSVFMAKLPYAEAKAKYSLENEDTGEKLSVSGKELNEKGLPIRLDLPKSSAVWHVIKE